MGCYAVAQLGGPTAVINATLEGLYQAVKQGSGQLYGVRNGMGGLLEGDFFLLDDSLKGVRNIPGAYLGAGRVPANPENISRTIKNLVENEIEGLFLIGGNGTMWAGNAIKQELMRRNVDIKVIGLPKTVDNDLVGIDHSPGFPSSARYVAQAVQDIGLDLKAMKNFEQIRVIEIMGRNVGWLTAAANLYKNSPTDPPHLTILPEQDLDLELFLEEVKRVYHEIGYVVVAVSEGVSSKCGKVKSGLDLGNGGPIIPGNVAKQLSEFIRLNTSLRARGESLGILQRSFRLAVSPVDRAEAFGLGQYAYECMIKKMDGVMVTMHRLNEDVNKPYSVSMSTILLQDVGGLERAFPLTYTDGSFQIKKAYLEWLQPLIEKEQSFV